MKAAHRPIPISVERAAQVFGVTIKTVRSWIREGLPVLRAGGKGRGNGALIDLAELIPWYLKENAFDAAKTRLASAQADKQEMANATRGAELAEIQDLERTWAGLVREFRAKMLSMPTKLGPQLINVSSPAIVAARLAEEINVALRELGRGSQESNGRGSRRAACSRRV